MKLGLGLRVCGRGTVDDGFAHADEVGEGHVGGAHCDFFGGGVDVGDFVDVGVVFAAEEGGEPFRGGLLAGYEAFGAELWCLMSWEGFD